MKKKKTSQAKCGLKLTLPSKKIKKSTQKKKVKKKNNVGAAVGDQRNPAKNGSWEKGQIEGKSETLVFFFFNYMKDNTVPQLYYKPSSN